MIRTDVEALTCDMAETYHVLNFRDLPLSLAATLACGLGPSSRIMSKLSGQTVSDEMLMLAAILDRLTILQWFQTEDGQKGRHRPESVYLRFAGEEPEREQVEGFDSSADFEAALKKITKGGESVK